jgi:hypothetical protein
MSLTAAQQHLNIILQRKGQIATFVTERAMKVRKGMQPITKRSEFQCRVGVNYDNIAAVKDKRENGLLPEENAGLPWGTWHVFPYVIEHKGEYYVRCTVLRNDYRRPAVYIRNGEAISREVAQAECLASEFSDRGDGEVFNIKISSIVSVA